MKEKVEIDARLLEDLKSVSRKKKHLDKAVEEFRDEMVLAIATKLIGDLGMKDDIELVIGSMRILKKYGVPIQDTLSCIRELTELGEETNG